MILYLIIGFLAVSIVFYCLFAGADFGAGILGLFIEGTDEKEISEVIGPVWEANHVWLIVAVTILFMGFSAIYSTISLYLHIPILLVLIGIIFRGTAFAFMHYDAIKDRSAIAYRWTFNISSVLTPFFLGTTAGALMVGYINADASSFYEAYMAPWLNIFSFSVGLFCTCLFTFLAAIFMIGEAEDDQERTIFVQAAKITQLCAVISGSLVFVCDQWYKVPLVSLFLDSWIAISVIIVATISIAGIWSALNAHNVWISRFIAGAQILFILFAWFWIQHPVAINMMNGPDITFFNSAAPSSTLTQLLIALIVGSCLILPGLFILFRTFKTKKESMVQ